MLTLTPRVLRPGVSESFPFPTRHTTSEPRLAYFDVGHGPAVLLVHGLGGNFTHFELIAAPLVRAGHRVIGVDMPGCGDSAKPDDGYTLDLYASATVRLLDELGVDEATFVGHSLGGQVVTLAALRWPDRVSRLVLMNSAGFHRYPRLLQLAARCLVPGLVAKAMELWAHRLLANCFGATNEHTRRFVGQAVGRPAHPTVDEFARTNCELLPDVARRHFLDDVERIRQPTLVLWGSKDRLLPVKDVPGWVARLPAGRLEILRGCGHMPLIERPEETVAAMMRFLRATASTAGVAASAAAADGESRAARRSARATAADASAPALALATA